MKRLNGGKVLLDCSHLNIEDFEGETIVDVSGKVESILSKGVSILLGVINGINVCIDLIPSSFADGVIEYQIIANDGGTQFRITLALDTEKLLFTKI